MMICVKKILLVACLCSVVACSSVHNPDFVYSDIDYTQEDARNEEAKRIEEIREGNSVQALWRSFLLNDDDVMQKCTESAVSDYNAAVAAEDWYNARRIQKSLAAVGSSAVGQLSKSGAELAALSVENVPGLKKASSSSPRQKVSEYVRGTVTVWVDKGIKVERGMGVADRVIGSGFFISEDGYIVTNHHVISDVVDSKNESYTRLYIRRADDFETRIPAKVVGWDSEIDLALLKAEIDADYVFALGSSADLSIGDKIYAIGSPVGLERTLTSGIVSADNRNLFSLGPVLQIDAAVNSGNSGGPCIDENGNVQGIVYAGMLMYEGLNFAIPVEYLKAVLPALYFGGKINHSWIGCYGHTKRELGKNVGVEIQYVFPGASASRAKLAVGDVIVAFDGQEVTTVEEFQNLLMKNDAKSIVRLTYRRGEETETECLLYLGVRPDNPGYAIYNGDIIAKSFLPIFGMKLVPVSTTSSSKYSIETIIKGSVADESGFSENDPIEIRALKLLHDDSVLYAEIFAKNRKKGYLDVGMAIMAELDGPYYF